MTKSNKPIDLDQVAGWPDEAHKIAPAAHAHAFGMIALWAALMEECLSILLAHYLPIKNDIAIPLIHKLAIRDRSELLRKLSRDNLPNPIATAGNPYVPVNTPAIDDLFSMFRFDRDHDGD